MTTIKSYTDIEQSRKLAEILPLESADMYYEWPNKKAHFKDNNYNGMGISCWSLAALLGVLPNSENISTTLSKGGYRISTLEYTNSWFVDYEDETNGLNNCVTSADNPVDACYEMITKLHELNLL
jgi:hypothetical protein